MATVIHSFVNSKYPLNFEYNPSVAELFAMFDDSSVTVSETATQHLFKADNGLFLRLTGTSLNTSAGVITRFDFLGTDGATVLARITTSVSVETFEDSGFDISRAAQWLLNQADIITGSAGDDELYGFGGNDVIKGGGGDDYIEGGEGKDVYDGGAGYDQIAFGDARGNQNAFRGIHVDATAGTVIDPYGNSETFTSIESFRGTQFADTFKGSTGNEQFMGLGGRDRIDGGGGSTRCGTIATPTVAAMAPSTSIFPKVRQQMALARSIH